jgi:hypothetical protein
MVFDDFIIASLLEKEVPCTVFVERSKQVVGPLTERFGTMQLVYQKSARLDYGVFHSKLMLLEFEDRLRVVVSSSNLYEHDWHHMSQVIWL